MSEKSKSLMHTDFTTYEVVKTKDGYPTLYSEHYTELCHSNVGSYEETVYNYVNAIGVKKMLQTKDKTVLLEMGYGTGIGLLATLDEYDNSKTENSLEFHSMEIDEGLFQWSLQHILGEKYPWMKDYQIDESQGYKQYIINRKKIEIYVHIGDARMVVPKLIKKIKGRVDGFYQDPFSPTKNPRLWTVEWFKDLYELGTQGAILSTYSASSVFRKALLLSGWKFKNVVGFASKRGMTIAFKEGEMDRALKNKVERSEIQVYEDGKLEQIKPIR